MTRQEYEYLQERLSKLLSKSDYYGNKKQVYKEGVLAAKSVLNEVFHRQEKMEVQIIKSVTMREGDTDTDGFFRKAVEAVTEVQE